MATEAEITQLLLNAKSYSANLAKEIIATKNVGEDDINCVEKLILLNEYIEMLDCYIPVGYEICIETGAYSTQACFDVTIDGYTVTINGTQYKKGVDFVTTEQLLTIFQTALPGYTITFAGTCYSFTSSTEVVVSTLPTISVTDLAANPNVNVSWGAVEVCTDNTIDPCLDADHLKLLISKIKELVTI